MVDPVEQLARDDKWQLGAGDGTVFAPAFPRWLDNPGFWDGATVLQRAVAPLFTVTILDDEGHEVAARVTARRWTPAELTLQYRLGQGITATEVRTVQPGGIFVSEWRFAAYRPERIHLIAWTAQPGSRVERGSAAWHGALSFVVSAFGGDRSAPPRRSTDDPTAAPLRVCAEIACVGGADSWSAVRSEGFVPDPAWRLTPFVEEWRGHSLSKKILSDKSAAPEGTFFAAVHRSLDIEYAGAAATFAMRIVADDKKLRPSTAAAPSGARATSFGAASRQRWNDYFSSVPQFRCSDPYFETMWSYRWYTLRLNAVAPAPGSFAHATLNEGPGILLRPSALAAAGHVREMRWGGGSFDARALIRSFLDLQRDDGSIPPRIVLSVSGASGASVADWGEALRALEAVSPDTAFTPAMLPKLQKFADWLIATCDAAGSGMFDLAIDDPSGIIRGNNTKGVDATVYAYSLFRILERRAGDDAPRWKDLADKTRDIVRLKMWDRKNGMFSDVDATTLKMTRNRSAHCFLPYRTDIATETHVAGLERHLLNPKEFYSAFPVPSLAADDSRFSAEGEFGARRVAAAWNGRSHPSLSSDVADAIAHAARTLAPPLREHAAALIRRTIRMMFHDGDLHRVNSHEHYNPFTGHASVHRGADDVQHGWLNDLIVRHVMGVLPEDSAITIDPLPFGLEYAELTGLKIRGRTLDILIEGDAVAITLDGEKTEAALGQSVILS